LKRFAKGHELSGGYRRSNCFSASIMAKNAEVMDEPTSALDAKAESEVLFDFISLIENKQ
jgi:ATP-binding cassette subfamily B protein